MNYCNLHLDKGHGNVERHGAVCYIIICSSISMLLVLLKFPDSLLETNYLKSIIIVHVCFFTGLEMPLSVNCFLNSKQLSWTIVYKPHKACQQNLRVYHISTNCFRLSELFSIFIHSKTLVCCIYTHAESKSKQMLQHHVRMHIL